MAKSLVCRHFDTDDYYWQPTVPPYTIKRAVDERRALLGSDLRATPRWVLSGSLAGWGDVFILMFDVVVFLTAPTAVRVERLAAREAAELGASRIAPGGDMYENYQAFLSWASAYDDGDTSMRSRQLHEAWLADMPCPVLRLDGTQPTDVLVAAVKAFGAGAG